MKNEEVYIYFILLGNYSPEDTEKEIMKERGKKKKKMKPTWWNKNIRRVPICLHGLEASLTGGRYME